MDLSLNIYPKAYVALVKHLDLKEQQIILIDQDVHVCGIFG